MLFFGPKWVIFGVLALPKKLGESFERFGRKLHIPYTCLDASKKLGFCWNLQHTQGSPLSMA